MIVITNLSTVKEYGNWEKFCELTGYDSRTMDRFDILNKPDDLFVLPVEDAKQIFKEGL